MKPDSSQTSLERSLALHRRALPSGLYVVATPIGNLRDITLRALEALHSADLIACEDTRVTGKLLRHFGIHTPMEPYHEHNAAKKRPELLTRIAAGGAVALVSDAGTPLVSDPGYKLVREAAEAGLRVEALPGASSVLAGLCVSALPTDRFLFAGFLPAKDAAARRELQELSAVPATLIFFESAKRVAATLTRMAEILGDREAAIARELTKLHEEVRRGTLSQLRDFYVAAAEPRGEIVLLVGPSGEEAVIDEAMIDERLRSLLSRHSLKDAVAAYCAETGLPKGKIYARALALKGKP